MSRYRRSLAPPLSLPLTPGASPTRSRQSPDVTSSVIDDGGDENEDARQSDDFEEKAFFVLAKTTQPRNWCITVVMWPYPFCTIAVC